MVHPASALRHHVVDGEVAEGEHHPTAVAQSLLLTEQYVLVLPVWYGRVDVGWPAGQPPDPLTTPQCNCSIATAQKF